jgi:sec-independent protein translocase protein TatB
MFDIGWSEFVVIGVVALIVIGPKELPAVLRAIGQWTTKIRRMAGEFQSQFQEAMREAEMADLKKQVDGLGEAAKGLTDLDALDLDVSKWDPKPDPKSDSKTVAETDSKTEPALEASPDSAPVAVPAEAQDVVSPAESAAVEAPQPPPDRSPAGPPDVGSTSEPRPTVPLTEGGGRA